MSAWIEHVKSYAKTNKINYKDALKEASLSYKEKTKEPEITKPKPAKKANETIENAVPPEKVKKVRIIRTIV